MLRTITTIVWAILQSQPGMPIHRASSYATTIQSEAKRVSFDSLTFVALIHHESSWRSHLVSADGEDIGLGQIRARFVGACRDDPSPVKAPGKACRAVRASLQNGHYNIKRIAGALATWRKVCRKRTGQALLRHTLMGYGGLSRPSKRQWCGRAYRRNRWRDIKAPWVVRRIINRRRSLIRKLRGCRRRCTGYRSVGSRLMRLRKSRR